jgi:hypothetical protein
VPGYSRLWPRAVDYIPQPGTKNLGSEGEGEVTFWAEHDCLYIVHAPVSGTWIEDIGSALAE